MQCIPTSSDNWCYRCVADSGQNYTKIHFLRCMNKCYLLSFFFPSFPPLKVHLLSKKCITVIVKTSHIPKPSTPLAVGHLQRYNVEEAWEVIPCDLQHWCYVVT